MSSFQQVQADSDVSVEESVIVKSCLSCGLNADKDYGLHCFGFSDLLLANLPPNVDISRRATRGRLDPVLGCLNDVHSRIQWPACIALPNAERLLLHLTQFPDGRNDHRCDRTLNEVLGRLSFQPLLLKAE